MASAPRWRGPSRSFGRIVNLSSGKLHRAQDYSAWRPAPRRPPSLSFPSKPRFASPADAPRLTAETRLRKFNAMTRCAPSLRITALLGAALLPFLAACGPPKEASQRPFAMGFTSYPYDVDPADAYAIDYTYEKIAANGDLI